MTDRRPLVSLCIIARDEETNLRRCLTSAAGAADEMIVVDTGSRDDTVAVAQELGARVEYFPWCNDFAAARNYGLDQATGEWVLVLDADDELTPEACAAIPELARNALAEVAGFAFSMASWMGNKPGGHLMTVTHPRLWRNWPQHRYHGAIHEWIRVDGLLLYTDLRIYHHGYLDQPGVRQAKFNRNVALLTERLQAEPDRAYYLFQLGVEYLRMRQPRRAVPYLRRAWALEQAAFFADQLGAALIRAGYLQEATRVMADAAGRWPDYTDLHYRLGCAHLLLGNPTAARRALARCVELGPAPADYPAIEGHGTFLAWFQLGQTEMDLHNFSAAAAAFRQALAAKPNYHTPVGDLLRAWVAADGPAAALLAWQNQIEAPPEVTLQAARSVLAWGCPRMAADLTAGLSGPDVRLLQAECCLALGDHRGAQQLLAEAGPDRLEVQVQQALVALLTSLDPTPCPADTPAAGRATDPAAAMTALARAAGPQPPLQAEALLALGRYLSGDPTCRTAPPVPPRPRRVQDAVLDMAEHLARLGAPALAEAAVALLGGERAPVAIQARAGRLLLRWGHAAAALPWLERALTGWHRRPGRRAVEADHGTALLELNRFAEAAASLRRAVAGGGGRLRTHLALAEALAGAAGRSDLREALAYERRRAEPVHDRPQRGPQPAPGSGQCPADSR